MTMPCIGDTLVVSSSHPYFYQMKATFTYLGEVNRGDEEMFFGPAAVHHAIRNDITGKKYDHLLTRTIEIYFTNVTPQIQENE